MTRFWICLRFWICQRYEYSGVLNTPELWICWGSELLLVLNMSGSWIYHKFKYVRVRQVSQYAWICLNNSWICLFMPECAWVCLNGFCFTFTHCNPSGAVFLFKLPRLAAMDVKGVGGLKEGTSGQVGHISLSFLTYQ